MREKVQVFIPAMTDVSPAALLKKKKRKKKKKKRLGRHLLMTIQ